VSSADTMNRVLFTHGLPRLDHVPLPGVGDLGAHAGVQKVAIAGIILTMRGVLAEEPQRVVAEEADGLEGLLQVGASLQFLLLALNRG